MPAIDFQKMQGRLPPGLTRRATIVPLAFTVAEPLTARQRLAVGVLFVLGTAAVAAATLVKYLLNPAAANELRRSLGRFNDQPATITVVMIVDLIAEACHPVIPV